MQCLSMRVKDISDKNFVFEDHLEIGYNYRMTDIQAAIGIKQLDKLDMIINERRNIALKYIDELKDIDCIRLPVEEEGYFLIISHSVFILNRILL